MGKRKFMSTRVLKPGIRIDQSIIAKDGRILIQKGTILDDFQIDYLLTQGIMGIYIYEGVPDLDEQQLNISAATQRVIEQNRREDPVKVSLSESVRKQVGEGISHLFRNTESSDFTKTSNTIANELENTIINNDAIAVDIRELKVSDEYTFRHSVDVATISLIIGKKLGLKSEQLHELGMAGLLHDIGKSRIPLEILNKPGKLTEEEFEIMKLHSTYGYKILKEKNQFSPQVLLGVLQHHEKLSGRGYPMGNQGNMIHLYGRIISVADIFDALVTKRPYKEPYGQREAMEILLAMGDDLDINILTAFKKSMILYPVDSIVKLSNGKLAKVVKNHPDYPMRPTVVELDTGRVLDLYGDFKCNSLVLES